MVELLSLASESRRLVLLEGPPACGKTSAVRDLAWLRNARLVTVSVHADTEGSDLIGSFAPCRGGTDEECLAAVNGALRHTMHTAAGGELFDRILARALAACAVEEEDQEATDEDEFAVGVAEAALGYLPEGLARDRLAALLDAHKRRGEDTRLPFSLVFGPLVIAMQCGHWLLLDNINAASPEVIERINSLGEHAASLHLFELGEGKRTPHPAFRLFATGATRRASSFALSDAFRTRCLVVQCEPIDAPLAAEDSDDAASERADAEAELASLAISCGCTPAMARALVRAHGAALLRAAEPAAREAQVCGYELTVRNFRMAALMVARGAELRAALHQAYGAAAPPLASDGSHLHSTPAGARTAAVVSLRSYLEEHAPASVAAFAAHARLLEMSVPAELARAPPPCELPLCADGGGGTTIT
jgi:hypothetical protein